MPEFQKIYLRTRNNIPHVIVAYLKSVTALLNIVIHKHISELERQISVQMRLIVGAEHCMTHFVHISLQINISTKIQVQQCDLHYDPKRII